LRKARRAAKEQRDTTGGWNLVGSSGRLVRQRPVYTASERFGFDCCWGERGVEPLVSGGADRATTGATLERPVVWADGSIASRHQVRSCTVTACGKRGEGARARRIRDEHTPLRATAGIPPPRKEGGGGTLKAARAGPARSAKAARKRESVATTCSDLHDIADTYLV
jgi:hypothetical protein